MERDKLIWELQGLVQEEYAIKNKKELREMADELRILQGSVKRAEEELQKLGKEAAEGEKRALELEKQTGVIAKQVKNGKEKLYETKGASLKELLSMQQSVQKMEEEIEKNEALYLETINEIEEKKNRQQQTRDIVKSLKTEYNEKLRVYREKAKQTELELAALSVKMEQVRERLDPEALRFYQDTLKRFPLNPVAVMRGESCSGCNIEIPMVLARRIREGKILYRCDNCGRILISGV